MHYSFSCPLNGCGHIMTVNAQDKDEAIDVLTDEAKKHLAIDHPEVEKTDEQIRQDIASQITTIEMKNSDTTDS